MRLKVKQGSAQVHSELTGAVGWNVWNELYSCSDDQNIHKWNMLGEPEQKVCQLDAYYTDIHWYPLSSKKTQAGGTDVFAVACTDGSVKIISRTGRVEKSIEAHRGACISLRWSFDGTALATAGEDGSVKIWSRNGMLRSTLAQADSPVYSIVWAYDCDQLCYCTGSNVVIKSLTSNAKQNAWKAHDGVVLKVDWSPINHLIVSGGEDCKYKVWDSFGRLLYQSGIFDYPVTSVSWSPSGEQFAVGSFNSLQLCDRMGWAYSKVHLKDAGSIMSLSWTADSTQLAGAGGSGSVVFGQVVDLTLEDGKMQVTVVDEHRIVVNDILNENADELPEFRDRVIKVSLGYGYLIVATATQCHVYNTNNLNTPHIFDLKDTVTLLLQIYTYEGRQICNPRFQGLRTELLNADMISLSNDTIAVLDQQASGTTVRFFDTAQGRPLGEPWSHTLEVKEIALSQAGTIADRQLIIIDRNRDLYLLPVMKRNIAKLAAMCDSARWHDTTAMLAAMVDQRLCVWYYPSEVYVDKDLLTKTRYTKADSDFGKSAQIQLFAGNRCLVRRSDGVLVSAATSPYPAVLYDMVRRQQWEKATRLCRFIKDPTMWATLAAMAMAAKELNTAEAAFAAIDEVDKTHFVRKVKLIPTEEGRNSELALYRHRPEEAEAVLLQAGLVYRAIKLNIKLFNFERALDLAVQYKQHQDTVLWYRAQFLRAAKQQETVPRFMQMNESVRKPWRRGMPGGGAQGEGSRPKEGITFEVMEFEEQERRLRMGI
ncbi:intraflagellar transport protein IFT80 [Volvox carteri f. nagariensis]|uniref:Intraflagellar transport protein IFT80 n=1 Tax=Volvox carteri f. nagariensis TaxID=3068 RepID=D8UGB3_VOLCA|nr:intraflagellar transport protein IFT80 [Volvox carteri f. nagariensis]EFJ41230.1 intraflagellar transport protein IFT80 [Volvox carteri f. nagariensis]|eukprot:XP_002957681.1 intraflagellar transport protein IFT80 [Volvox carteri f. nagariensis]